MLKAFWATGTFGVADVFFVVDADDMHIDQYEEILGGDVAAQVIRMPEWQPLVPKLNAAAVDLAPKYRAVVFMGDDHVPISPMWAHTLLHNHTFRPNSIWYGPDGFQGMKLPSWWSMSSSIIKALGRMVPAPVQHMFCDNSVLELGKAAACLSYDERIFIEHRHPYAGKAKLDEQYQRVNRPEQYERDGQAFRQWMADGLQADVKIVQSVGG
jgi:hypothetical protein